MAVEINKPGSEIESIIDRNFQLKEYSGEKSKKNPNPVLTFTLVKALNKGYFGKVPTGTCLNELKMNYRKLKKLDNKGEHPYEQLVDAFKNLSDPQKSQLNGLFTRAIRQFSTVGEVLREKNYIKKGKYQLSETEFSLLRALFARK